MKNPLKRLYEFFSGVSERDSHKKAAVKPRPLSTNKNTLDYKVKTYLLEGNSITTLECIDLFHSTELRATIARLRKHMDIQDQWITTDSGKRVKRYFYQPR